MTCFVVVVVFMASVVVLGFLGGVGGGKRGKEEWEWKGEEEEREKRK